MGGLYELNCCTGEDHLAEERQMTKVKKKFRERVKHRFVRH